MVQAYVGVLYPPVYVYLSQYGSTTANLLLLVCCCCPGAWAEDVDPLQHGHRSAADVGECGQCHVFSIRSQLNTGLLI